MNDFWKRSIYFLLFLTIGGWMLPPAKGQEAQRLTLPRFLEESPQLEPTPPLGAVVGRVGSVGGKQPK